MSYFPMFVELEGTDCLVVGGGPVALRKVKVLQDFGAVVTVIAPCVIGEIRELATVVIQREFQPEDVVGRYLVVAATGEVNVNQKISRICKEKGIPINAVDQQEDCTFIFPSYVKSKEVVAAFSSGGQSPAVTQYLKEKAKPFMTEHIGNIAACLGEIREQVKAQVSAEAERKRVYEEILTLALESEEIPTEEHISEVINKY